VPLFLNLDVDSSTKKKKKITAKQNNHNHFIKIKIARILNNERTNKIKRNKIIEIYIPSTKIHASKNNVK